MKLIAFDLEIAEPFPEDGDVRDYAALGISCAATLTSDGIVHLWPESDLGGMYPMRLSVYSAYRLVDYLRSRLLEDYKLVTWNGNFDFQVLAHACDNGSLFRECQTMARQMYDPMFQMLCERGFPVGLEKVSKAMKLGTKEGMTGKDAPILWRESREQQNRVLEYVQGDAKLTLDVFQAIQSQKHLLWITRAGHVSQHSMSKLLTIEESIALVLPDISWWTGKPFIREQFVGWLEEEIPHCS